MKTRKPIAPVAAITLLVPAIPGTAARADSVIEVDLAQEVREKYPSMPPISDGSAGTVTVAARNGVLRLSGLVEDLDGRRAIDDVLESVEGLHVDRIDDHIVRN